MSKSKLIFSVIAFVLLGAGIVLSFWPLCLVGLLLAAATGRYITAVLSGLLLDILYGAPAGFWHTVHVPFTLLAFCICALHWYLLAYFREGATGRL